MSEILGTLGPCCNIIRRGECAPGTMHSGLCREQHGGELGPTIYLCDADSITALQARVAELTDERDELVQMGALDGRELLQRAERASELAASTRAQRDELQREQEHLSDMVSAVQELEKQSCAIIRAVSDDVPITTPTRDYSALSPMDCYEAGLLDGGAAVRAYIHAAIDAALKGAK